MRAAIFDIGGTLPDSIGFHVPTGVTAFMHFDEEGSLRQVQHQINKDNEIERYHELVVREEWPSHC